MDLQSARIRSFLWVGGGGLAYLAAFFVLYPTAGMAAASLSALPVIVAAWCFGLRAGLFAGLLTVPLDTLLIEFGGGVGLNTLIERGVPGFVAVIVVGVVV